MFNAQRSSQLSIDNNVTRWKHQYNVVHKYKLKRHIKLLLNNVKQPNIFIISLNICTFKVTIRFSWAATWLFTFCWLCFGRVWAVCDWLTSRWTHYWTSHAYKNSVKSERNKSVKIKITIYYNMFNATGKWQLIGRKNRVIY